MKKIIIVDDSMFSRKKLKDVVAGSDYEVAGEADNGYDGLQLYKNIKPDGVIMDLIMPKRENIKGGIDAIAEIKKFDPQAKIMVCSSLGSEQIIIDALNKGATEFVTKPVKKEKILGALNRIFK